jgi:hypothetical protein
VVVYSAWVFTGDPVYGAWAAQNRISSPHPLHLLAAYGLLLILAAFAVRKTWRSGGWTWMALSWVTAALLLAYVPVNLQLRLMTGVQVPLSLLAAQGAIRLWQSGRVHRGLTSALLLPMIFTSVFLLVASSAWMLGRPSPSFRDAAEVAAMDWLAAHSEPGDAILTACETGAYLPARVNVRVLVGHDLEARNAEKKRMLVDRFFDTSTDDGWRQRFLRDYSIDYVLWGPTERELGQFDPSTASYLRRVHAAEAYAVYAVEP